MASSARTRSFDSIWSVQLHGGTFVCELRRIDLAWEVQLHRDGWLVMSRRFMLHGEAMEFSAILRRNFERTDPGKA